MRLQFRFTGTADTGKAHPDLGMFLKSYKSCDHTFLIHGPLEDLRSRHDSELPEAAEIGIPAHNDSIGLLLGN